MDVLACINEKRSSRAYTDEVISKDVIKNLIELGTKAATGSNQQPWGFVTIDDKEEIDHLSEITKTYLKEHLADYPYLAQYESWFDNPNFSVFNHAANLILIYGNTKSHWYVYDCSLAAGNIMLAAHSMGIGTCWIGFAEHTLNTKEFKETYHIPEEYQLVSTLSLGYMSKHLNPPKRKEPLIFHA